MLKNIKLFSTDSDRTTYESSASYETPYVSKVSADNSVHYNKQIRTIEFTVEERFTIYNPFHYVTKNVTYQAKEGMTWSDWIESEYNINYYSINPYYNEIQYKSNDEEHVSSEGRNTYLIDSVSPEDTIIENNVYTALLLQQ